MLPGTLFFPFFFLILHLRLILLVGCCRRTIRACWCFCSNSSAVLAPFFMGRFNCTLHGSADQVSTVPPLDLPQAQLPGKTFTIKCETRRLLPRESWRRGCWLRTTTVWNFFAVCHTRRKLKADVGRRRRRGEGGEEAREGERKQSAIAARSDAKSCTDKSTAVSARQKICWL